MLDWLNSVCCIGYILDDFNAKSVNSSKEQNTWKELIKQIHDANSTKQHDKFRFVLSAVFFTSNNELCPWCDQLQSRLATYVFYLNERRCSVLEEQQYKTLSSMLSCLVPEILSWKFQNKLDRKYIAEVQQYIEKLAQPLSLTQRIAQHMKKPMYMLLLFLKWIEAPPESFKEHVFAYLRNNMLPRYWRYCAQSNMWFKFLYYFAETRNVCNVRSYGPMNGECQLTSGP